jgi:hypothetical protein
MEAEFEPPKHVHSVVYNDAPFECFNLAPAAKNAIAHRHQSVESNSFQQHPVGRVSGADVPWHDAEPLSVQICTLLAPPREESSGL